MRRCSKCGHPIPPGSRFCGVCGAKTEAEAEAPAASGAPICSACGVLVDASRSSCEACGAPHASPPVHAAPQPGAGFWVAVRATFTCNACRFEVPLNHFELGEGVVCTRCGVEQRYDGENWRRLVEFAHGVGDLGAPGPEGRFPDPSRPLEGGKPYGDLGTRASWAERRPFRASPGNPLCKSCRAPRVVLNKNGPRLEVGCSRCGDRRSYEVPERERRLLNTIAGVLADEHEADRKEAAIVDERGVAVLRCANCAAPLSGVKDEDGIVHCHYCGVDCTISSHTHARVGHRQTPIKTWWLYFEGPSAERQAIHRRAAERAARAERDRAEQAARAERDRAEQAAREAERRSHRERMETAERKANEKAKSAERRALIPLLSVVLTVPVFVGAFYVRQAKSKRAKEAAVAALPSDALLSKYSFSMTPAQASALFGVQAKPGATVKFKEPGVFKSAHLGLGGGGPTFSIDLQGGANFDAKTAHARLAALAPNRLSSDASGHDEISVRGRATLRVNGAALQSVSVMTWVEGEAGIALADAFLAAARHATMNGPMPTPEELRLLNGPPLADAERIDATVTTDHANQEFEKAFPSGDCRTVTNLVDKTTALTCTVEVDHPVFSRISYAWSNVAKGRLQRVRFDLATPPEDKPATDASKCLTSGLGPGKTKVTDFASNEGELTWSFGSHGDRAALDGYSFRLVARDGAGNQLAPDWQKEYAKIVGAVVRCSRQP